MFRNLSWIYRSCIQQKETMMIAGHLSRNRRLILLSVGLTILLAPRPVLAGQWQFSASATIVNTSNGVAAAPVSLSSPPSSGGASIPGGGTSQTGSCGINQTVTISGGETMQVTWTAQWVPAASQTIATDPPPAVLSVLESPSASYGAGSDDLSVTGTGTADDGFHDFPTPGSGMAQSALKHTLQFSGTSGHASWSETLTATYNLTMPVEPFARTYHGSCGTGESITLFTSDIQARSTAGTWDSHNPLWFSGTNCIVNGHAAAMTGTVTQAQLLINGVIVSKYPRDYPGMPSGLAALDISAAFDSTHFPNATPLTFSMQVWDSNGGYYDAASNISAPTSNPALILKNKHTEDRWNRDNIVHGTAILNTWNHIQSVSRNANYNVTPSQSLTNFNILDEIKNYTVFYQVAHGMPGYFDDCLGTGDSRSGVGYGSVQFAEGQKWILQPGGKKEYILPPYNFVMLNCCLSGSDDSLSKAFGINNKVGGLDDPNCDRAFMGFSDYIFQWSSNQDWTERVWNNLAGGETLIDATDDASADGNVYGQNGLAVFKICFPVIYGDLWMTWHRVYAGPTLYSWYNPE